MTALCEQAGEPNAAGSNVHQVKVVIVKRQRDGLMQKCGTRENFSESPDFVLGDTLFEHHALGPVLLRV